MRLPAVTKRALGVALALTVGACATILGFRPRERGPFEHREHVLQGIHCSRCHGGVVGAGDEGPLHIPGKAECMSCHERPHDARSCDLCHGLPETREGATLARKNLRFQHKTHVPRVRGDCVRCHVDIHRDVEAIRPGMGTCLACHEHEDEFQVRDCDRCHGNLHTEQTQPSSHLVHEGDWRREHGARAGGAREMCETCHSESFCAGCHGAGTAATTPERLRSDDPFSPGVHRGGFRARHGNEARGNPGLCTTCHQPEACADCHRDEGRSAAGDAPGTPHPRGWLGLQGESNDHGPAARRDPGSCAACHSGPGEALCIGCHRVGGIGGDPHPPGWSSSLRPRLDAACRPCHEATR